MLTKTQLTKALVLLIAISFMAIGTVSAQETPDTPGIPDASGNAGNFSGGSSILDEITGMPDIPNMSDIETGDVASDGGDFTPPTGSSETTGANAGANAVEIGNDIATEKQDVGQAGVPQEIPGKDVAEQDFTEDVTTDHESTVKPDPEADPNDLVDEFSETPSTDPENVDTSAGNEFIQNGTSGSTEAGQPVDTNSVDSFSSGVFTPNPVQNTMSTGNFGAPSSMTSGAGSNVLGSNLSQIGGPGAPSNFAEPSMPSFNNVAN